MALRYPRVAGLITANSYSQLKKATLVKVFQLLEELGIDYEYKQQDAILIIGEATIYCLSMEKYDLLRGIEVGWAWSDECAFYKEEAFHVLIGRIRDNRAPCQWKGTTTPNGYNWLHSAFVEKPYKSSKIVFSSTNENALNLADVYIESLRELYDDRLASQELDGQFVNLNSGNVYYNFDRKQHCKPINPGDMPIFTGLDFNVHPLCGAHVVEKNGIIQVFSELYLEDSNTFEAAKEIIKSFPMKAVYVIPDDSGNKRKTSSNTTDHEILRRANLHVLSFKNPGIKDRYNNINRLLHHGKLFIDPKCVKLIADLEKLTYENTDPMLSHASDALGYVCWHLQPFKKPKRDAQVRYY